eukprot:COSAG05_NODE_6197_length_1002_cov_0.776301_1_plen_86_part_00
MGCGTVALLQVLQTLQDEIAYLKLLLVGNNCTRPAGPPPPPHHPNPPHHPPHHPPWMPPPYVMCAAATVLGAQLVSVVLLARSGK